MYEPKLRTPLIAFIAAALCIALVLKVRVLPEWLRLFLSLMAIILGVVGVVTLSDWVSYIFSTRLKEYNAARTYGLKIVSDSIKGLTRDQANAVLALDQTYITMIAEQAGPIFFVRCLTRDVPFNVVEEFLILSHETRPFLYPVRAFSSELYASEITNLIVARGWAEKATGVHPAKLLKPLPWVAARFGVEIDAQINEKAGVQTELQEV